MKTESNTRPDPLQIRKLGVIDDDPVVYLYLNSNVKQVTESNMNREPGTMYTYDMVQITNPMPATLLPEIDLTSIADHAYNQTAVKKKAVNRLDEIKTRLGKATTENTRQIDRRDKPTTPKQADLDRILITKKTASTTS